MNHEFEKLDILMDKTKPTELRVPPIKKEILQKRPFLIPGLVGGFCILLIIFTIVHLENQKVNQVLELSEVLAWDFSTDEFEDYESTLAFFESN